MQRERPEQCPLIAVEAGATHVQSTMNGYGERCGNANLVSVIAGLELKMGHEAVAPGQLSRLSDIARYIAERANLPLRSDQPFVGKSAFAHKGGMHVHAVNRIAESYEHINPELVGNERRVLVSELSGRSNIVAKTTKYRLDHDADLMKRILDTVQELEAAGYQFEASEASFDCTTSSPSGVPFSRCATNSGSSASAESTPWRTSRFPSTRSSSMVTPRAPRSRYARAG